MTRLIVFVIIIVNQKKNESRFFNLSLDLSYLNASILLVIYNEKKLHKEEGLIRNLLLFRIRK